MQPKRHRRAEASCNLELVTKRLPTCAKAAGNNSSGKRAGKRFQTLDKSEVNKRCFFGKVLLNPTQNRRSNIVRMQNREQFFVKGHLKLKLATGKLK